MIACRFTHVNYKQIEVQQVRRRPLPKAETLILHAFFKEIKHLLRNVFDLNRVVVGFSADKTAPLNQFILEIYRILGGDSVRRGIFVVLFDGAALLFAGIIRVA